MNKNNRRILPTVIALLVMVTAMCAVGSADEALVTITKEVSSIAPNDDGDAFYDLYTGDLSTIVYDITVTNVDTGTVTVTSIEDTMPYDTGGLCTGPDRDVNPPCPPTYTIASGDSGCHTIEYTVDVTDIVCLNDGPLVEGDVISVTNRLLVCGHTEGGDIICDCEDCTVDIKVIDTEPRPTPTFETPPTDVPAQSPIGIMALIGLLGLIGAGMIIGRR